MEEPGAFEFRRELGWCWLQRLAIAVLRWIGAQRLDRQIVWTRYPDQNDKLLSSLLGQEGEFHERLYDGEQMHIYMGPEEYPELMLLVDTMGTHVTFPGRIKIGRGQGAAEFHDIPITVVPWMKGAVIVPR